MGLDPECKWTETHLAQKLGVILQTINPWISDIRARQRANRNISTVRLGRLRWAQEQIAKVVGLDRSAVSRIVQNTKFGEMHNFLEQGKDMAWIADHYHIESREIDIAEKLGAIQQTINSWISDIRARKGPTETLSSA